MNFEQKSRNFCLNNLKDLYNIKNLPSGDFFILFNTNALKTNLKLSANIIWKPKNCCYICNRLPQINVVLGRYSSGQRGQTVNLLCELRRFESCSPHKKSPEELSGLLSFIAFSDVFNLKRNSHSHWL